jgi:hypothetical protein
MKRWNYPVDFAARLICIHKGEDCYTHFGIAPREVGLAQSASQKISEGRPILKGRGL